LDIYLRPNTYIGPDIKKEYERRVRSKTK